jgi:diguanylate cyclase (GGDEF)-like protein
MNHLEKIIETLKKNQEIARAFFEIEASVLSVLNFRDFLERLLNEIREKRQIPYVWISLTEEGELSGMIKKSVSREVLADRVNFIEKEVFVKLAGDETIPLLVNEGLEDYHELIPQHYRDAIKSLAVAPLTLDGDIIGSLNNGDESGFRYRPGMDTTLLKQLATIVSICLSNVMAHEKLKYLASRDSLTGLLNRRVLEQILKREAERSLRYRTPLAVVFLDLDGFKKVNDQYGHKIGDDFLKHVANSLMMMTRGSDVVARFAGDEFIIVLPGTSYPYALEFAERMQGYFTHHPLVIDGGASIPVSLSFGVSCVEERTSECAESLLQRADKMLYEAKRNKCC